MQISIRVNPQNYDHDDVSFYTDDGEQLNGHGFLPRDGDQTIGLVRCPVCQKENYALNVSTGTCYACGFDANTLDIKTGE